MPIKPCLAIIGTFFCFLAPYKWTFFRGCWFVGIPAPVRAGTSIRTFWVTGTFIDTFDLISATFWLALFISKTPDGALVTQICALVSTLIRNISIIPLFKAVRIRLTIGSQKFESEYLRQRRIVLLFKKKYCLLERDLRVG